MAVETATVEPTTVAAGANSGVVSLTADQAAVNAGNGQGGASGKAGEVDNLAVPQYTQAQLDAAISKSAAKMEANLRKQFEHEQSLKAAEAEEKAAKTAEELRRAQEEKRRIEHQHELYKIRGIQDANILAHLDKAEIPPKLRPLFTRLEDGKEYEENMRTRIDSLKEILDGVVNEEVAKRIKSPAPESTGKTSSNLSGGQLRSIYQPMK